MILPAQCVLQASTSKKKEDMANCVKVQCDYCEDWIHDSCTGSDDYVKYICNEEPSGVHHRKGGLAIHLWFCKSCKEKHGNLRQKLLNALTDLRETNDEQTQHAEEVDSQNPVQSSQPTNQNSVSVQTPTPSKTNKPAITSINESETSNSRTPNNVSIDQTRQICSYYKKGICRYGKFGNRLINGRECRFYHPKKCLKYCRFGDDQEQGCAGSCGLFHPTLCRNSINFKKCLQQD